jgi:hypothetical protein
VENSAIGVASTLLGCRWSSPSGHNGNRPQRLTGRVTHAALNKDNGLVDPNTGAITGPSTPRGIVQDNFAKAVAGAVAESRRQWQDFQSEVTSRYAEEKAALMTCSLTHDDPRNDCNEVGGRVLVGVVVVAAAVVVALAAVLLIRRRRSRRAAA